MEEASTEELVVELRSRMTIDSTVKLATLRDELTLLASCITGPSFIYIFNLLLLKGPLDFFQIQTMLREQNTPYSHMQVHRVLKRLDKQGLIDKDDYGHWDVSTPAFRHLRTLMVVQKTG